MVIGLRGKKHRVGLVGRRLIFEMYRIIPFLCSESHLLPLPVWGKNLAWCVKVEPYTLNFDLSWHCNYFNDTQRNRERNPVVLRDAKNAKVAVTTSLPSKGTCLHQSFFETVELSGQTPLRLH